MAKKKSARPGVKARSAQSRNGARAERKPSERTPEPELPEAEEEASINSRAQEVVGILMILSSLALCLALWSYDPSDRTGDRNLVGVVGRELADRLLGMVGVVGYLAALFSVALAGAILFGRLRRPTAVSLLSGAAIVASATVGAHIMLGEVLRNPPGGALGLVLGTELLDRVGPAGTWLFVIGAGLLGVLGVADVSLVELLNAGWAKLRLARAHYQKAWAEGAQARAEAREARVLARMERREARAEARESRRQARIEARAARQQEREEVKAAKVEARAFRDLERAEVREARELEVAEAFAARERQRADAQAAKEHAREAVAAARARKKTPPPASESDGLRFEEDAVSAGLDLRPEAEVVRRMSVAPERARDLIEAPPRRATPPPPPPPPPASMVSAGARSILPRGLSEGISGLVDNPMPDMAVTERPPSNSDLVGPKLPPLGPYQEAADVLDEIEADGGLAPFDVDPENSIENVLVAEAEALPAATSQLEALSVAVRAPPGVPDLSMPVATAQVDPSYSLPVPSLALPISSIGSNPPPGTSDLDDVSGLVRGVPLSSAAFPPAQGPTANIRSEPPGRIDPPGPSERPGRSEPANPLGPRIHERKVASIPLDEDVSEALAKSGREKKVYRLPPLNLLDHQGAVPDPIDDGLLMERARRLESKLETYGVQGKVTAIRPGPVVTTYEYQPAPGVKVAKIANLQDDIAMSMEAVRVRIVAPIPGRGVVGIELPNETRENVYLKEIIAHDRFKESKSLLTLALGKDAEGDPQGRDLQKMPHLLVAGTTGSGKSVSINTMIISMLYKATPDEVKFIMVDPKMLELSLYNDIPHLLLPVVTDPRKASLALQWTVDEMERRYQLLSDFKVRDLDTFNKKLDRLRAQRDQVPRKGERQGSMKDPWEGKDLPERLPYIVVLIDEFADLMTVAPRDVETSVQRLAQKARAAGIHVLLATQRPSTDVITGVIKNNFPCRIAFRVASRHDSTTIINKPGAEALLGRGDSLMMDTSSPAPARIHGAFVSEEEVERVVEFWKDQGRPVYDETILKPRQDDEEGEGIAHEEADEHYDLAVRIVVETKRASISALQRKLRVGYNRAARMIEMMEAQGIVGPVSGPKGEREILVNAIGDDGPPS